MDEDIISRNKRVLASRQPGDIIFYHPITKNFFASLILFVTNQYYHHGAIVIDDTRVIEADPVQGVHVNDLEPYLPNYILDLYRHKNETNNNYIVKAALEYSGWSYDYGNVIWAGIGFIWYRLTGLSVFRHLKNPLDDSTAVNSEEYIDLVHKNCGIDLRPDIPASNISAQDLADSPLLFRVL